MKIKAKIVNIGDIIYINGRFHQIILSKGSNGFTEWEYPTIINYPLTYRSFPKEKIIWNIEEIKEIKSIELRKKDLPIDEEKIKRKEIFK